MAVEKSEVSFGNSLLPLEAVDFGEEFSERANGCLAKKTISEKEFDTIKLRTGDYVLQLVKELVQRFPHNIEVIEKIRYFAPQFCVLSSEPISANQLPWELVGDSIDRRAVETQWRRLQSMRLSEFSPELDADVSTEAFWIYLKELKDRSGEESFKELSIFALRALSLPISNAEIERMFSVMTIVKNKLRNRMLMQMLVAIMRIRIHLKVHGYCCRDYIPTKYMLEKFNSTMYDSKKPKTGANDNDENILTLELLETSDADEIFDLLATFEENCVLQRIN